MSALANLQHVLQTHLMGEDEQILNQLVLPIKGTIHERLAVYSNAYGWRLIDALEQEYGLLAKLLGDEAFVELTEAFIDAYPSQFYSIAKFSEPLVQFLTEYAPYSEQPYLSELVQLIKSLIISLEAADAPCLSFEALANVAEKNWPSLCFKFHPSVQYFSFNYNSFAIWQALVQEKSVPEVQRTKNHCVVWRKGLQSYAIALTDAETLVFWLLKQGSCFADVCEAVYNKGFMQESEAASFVANLLANWLNNHLFSEVQLS
ncbi:MAG: DNA-binding domain-containing protein [Candidatus Aquirickettsiella sp.]